MRSGRPLDVAEARLQLEAHGRLVAKWLARAAKLLERIQALRERSTSPGKSHPLPRHEPANLH